METSIHRSSSSSSSPQSPTSINPYLYFARVKALNRSDICAGAMSVQHDLFPAWTVISLPTCFPLSVISFLFLISSPVSVIQMYTSSFAQFRDWLLIFTAPPDPLGCRCAHLLTDHDAPISLCHCVSTYAISCRWCCAVACKRTPFETMVTALSPHIAPLVTSASVVNF